MQVQVVTPDASYFDGKAESCVLPAFDGEIGILPGHAPLIARMGHGVAVVTQSGKTTRVAIYGGFLKVQDDEVVVLAGGAATAKSSTKAAAEQGLVSAQDALSKAQSGGATAAENADLEEKLNRARALVALYAAG